MSQLSWIPPKDKQTPSQTPSQTPPQRRRRIDSICGRPGSATTSGAASGGASGAARLLRSALVTSDATTTTTTSRSSVTGRKVPGLPSSWAVSNDAAEAGVSFRDRGEDSRRLGAAACPGQPAGDGSAQGSHQRHSVGKLSRPSVLGRGMSRPSVLGRKSRASLLSMADRRLLQSLIGEHSDSDLWYSGDDEEFDEFFTSLPASEVGSPRDAEAAEEEEEEEVLKIELQTLPEREKETSSLRLSLSPKKAARLSFSVSPSRSKQRQSAMRSSTSPSKQRRSSMSPSKKREQSSMNAHQRQSSPIYWEPCAFQMCSDSDSDAGSHTGSQSPRSSAGSDGCGGGSLEDMFSFDPSLVAQALQDGAGLEKLTCAIENAMADNLAKRVKEEDFLEQEKRSARPSISPEDDLEGRMTPPDRGCGEIALETDDIAGRMTPPTTEEEDLAGRMTPPLREENDNTTLEETPADDLQGKLNAVMACAFARRRRSSAAHRREREQTECERDQVEAWREDKLLEQQKRWRKSVGRKSITKATKVVEASGNDTSDTSWEDKVELIQQAMEEARRRHNKSIAKAVQDVTGEVAASAPATEEKIRHAVSAARQRQQEVNQLEEHSWQESAWQEYPATVGESPFNNWGGEHAADVSVGAPWSPGTPYQEAAYSPACYEQPSMYYSPQPGASLHHSFDYHAAEQSPVCYTPQQHGHYQQQEFFTPSFQQQSSSDCCHSPQSGWGQDWGQPAASSAAYAHYGSA